MAEPQNIRDQFNEAIAMGHPLMKRVYLDTLVTGGCLLVLLGTCAAGWPGLRLHPRIKRVHLDTLVTGEHCVGNSLMECILRDDWDACFIWVGAGCSG